MAAELDTAALQRALGEPDGIQLVEVLPTDDYDEEHLPGARNVPFADLEGSDLDPTRTTVVYDFDLQDDRAHRAAVRLEAAGFADVRVYAAGKVAWLAEGLPSEGRRRPEQRVASIARTAGIPILRDGATLADAASVMGERDDVAVVLNADDVVLGVLRRETLGLAPSTLVADVLQPGPSTFRPSMTIAELVEYFRSSHETRAIVSTAGGRWLGLIRREDVVDG